MDDHVVYRDAGGPGEAPVSQEGGFPSLALDELAHRGIYFQGCDAGDYQLSRQSAGRRGDPSGFSHAIQFSGGFQSDEFHIRSPAP